MAMMRVAQDRLRSTGTGGEAAATVTAAAAATTAGATVAATAGAPAAAKVLATAAAAIGAAVAAAAAAAADRAQIRSAVTAPMKMMTTHRALGAAANRAVTHAVVAAAAPARRGLAAPRLRSSEAPRPLLLLPLPLLQLRAQVQRLQLRPLLLPRPLKSANAATSLLERFVLAFAEPQHLGLCERAAEGWGRVALSQQLYRCSACAPARYCKQLV